MGRRLHEIQQPAAVGRGPRLCALSESELLDVIEKMLFWIESESAPISLRASIRAEAARLLRLSGHEF